MRRGSRPRKSREFPPPLDAQYRICDYKCVYEIEFEENVERELTRIRPFDAKRIFDAIGTWLTHEPTVETKARKKLEGVRPPFRTVPPAWELRVGEYRVFYDVDEEEKRVYVRAVRRKPPHRTTEEIL